MKKILLLTMLLIVSISIKAQQQNYLRFRHIGEETKPIGTLTICLKKAIAPLDSGLNSQFGKTVITDRYTYRSIKRFINSSKNVIFDKKKLSLRNGTFQILFQDKSYGYLNDDKSYSFFKDLVEFLEKRESDKTVINLLNNYINGILQL